jgi:hypothetical protein
VAKILLVWDCSTNTVDVISTDWAFTDILEKASKRVFILTAFNVCPFTNFTLDTPLTLTISSSAVVGDSDGNALGLAVGSIVGDRVGTVDGNLLGERVDDGEGLGTAVEGLKEGIKEGVREGEKDGAIVEGDTVGTRVDGDAVGATGEAVGSGVNVGL